MTPWDLAAKRTSCGTADTDEEWNELVTWIYSYRMSSLPGMASALQLQIPI
jgi:hypothetical protein